MSYGRGFIGSKYEETKGLARTEIAKLFRTDVKQAIKRGELPKGLKLSVRCDSYSGGGSIDIKVTELPAGFKILNPERVLAQLAEPNKFLPEVHYPRLTPEAESLLGKLEDMIQAYNYDDSDPMVDYYRVRFGGGHPYFGDHWEMRDRAAIEAMVKPETRDACSVALDAVLTGDMPKANEVLVTLAPELDVLSSWDEKTVYVKGADVARQLAARLREKADAMLAQERAA